MNASRKEALSGLATPRKGQSGVCLHRTFVDDNRRMRISIALAKHRAIVGTAPAQLPPDIMVDRHLVEAGCPYHVLPPEWGCGRGIERPVPGAAGKTPRRSIRGARAQRCSGTWRSIGGAGGPPRNRPSLAQKGLSERSLPRSFLGGRPDGRGRSPRPRSKASEPARTAHRIPGQSRSPVLRHQGTRLRRFRRTPLAKYKLGAGLLRSSPMLPNAC